MYTTNFFLGGSGISHFLLFLLQQNQSIPQLLQSLGTDVPQHGFQLLYPSQYNRSQIWLSLSWFHSLTCLITQARVFHELSYKFQWLFLTSSRWLQLKYFYLDIFNIQFIFHTSSCSIPPALTSHASFKGTNKPWTQSLTHPRVNPFALLVFQMKGPIQVLQIGLYPKSL